MTRRLELAKKFGTDQSAQFVNGILDKLVPADRRSSRGEQQLEEADTEEDSTSEDHLMPPALRSESLGLSRRHRSAPLHQTHFSSALATPCDSSLTTISQAPVNFGMPSPT
ncbi:MAG: transcription antitermination factor NusB [Planctomycetaceae bacterium]